MGYALLGKVIRWFREQRQWREDYKLSWAPALEADSSGVTAYQRIMEQRITEALRAVNLRLSDRQLQDFSRHHPVVPNEKLIECAVPELDIRMWIYSCDVEIVTSAGEDILHTDDLCSFAPDNDYENVVNVLESLIADSKISSEEIDE